MISLVEGGRIRREPRRPRAQAGPARPSLGLAEAPAAAEAPEPAATPGEKRVSALLRRPAPARSRASWSRSASGSCIAGEKTAERGLAVPVELQNVPQDLELTGDAVNTVEVRVRASPGLITACGRASYPGHRSTSPGRARASASCTSRRSRSASPFGLPGGEDHALHPHPEPRAHAAERRPGAPAPDRAAGGGLRGRRARERPRRGAVAGPRSRVQEIESAFTEPVSVEGARPAPPSS